MTNALIASLLMLGIACAEEAMPLALVQTIPLPGVEGRIDHFALDARDQRLYLAALGNDTVEVIDLAAGTVIHQIAGQKEPQGLAVIPEAHEVVVANGDDGSVRFYDAVTWTLTASVDLKGDADNVRYDQAGQVVYVGFGDGGIAAIDARTHRVTARIPLPAHPESFALEAGGSRIFVNVPSAHRIAILDRATATPLAAWDLSTGFPEFFTTTRPSANFPMALDEADHRLFIGCRKPACLVVFDTLAGKPVARLDLSGDTDDIFHDATARRLYVSCGDGCIDVIAQTDADHYQRTARIATANGARTAFWAADRRRLYVAVPHRGSQPAAVMVFQAAP
jgi:DNA-binding beta-propeller fold protein YncE